MNAATVPHIAMRVPTMMMKASNQPHRLSITTLATTGPTIEIMKAENDPTKAIIELNPGIMIETVIDEVVTIMRWITLRRRFQRPECDPFGATERPSGLAARPSGDVRGTSSPSKISMVAFNCSKGFNIL